jgi:hypothetical protein
MRTLAALLSLVGLLLAARAGATSRAPAQEAIRQVFGNSRMARCIARHESSFNTRAVSDTDDWGLYQVNRPTWFGRVIRLPRRLWARAPRGWRTIYVQRRWIFDPVYNARVAFIISDAGTDWTPWSTLRYCR